ncbi:carboxypeptidase regulatory-like domain-containing protein [Acidicapsa dinghuensis]|uniref:Carboxypeptidase regulatory-like domain-containing protein n=1 Tax=Acidicapsa dinghuensis TaxID=2218256 RepID=A0ABW1EAZ1_9BACT|nr:TonB-dependent receptor [Acidicapsa dinghuensis]
MRRSLWFSLFLLLFSVVAHGQQLVQAVTGSVHDANGSPIASAEVRLERGASPLTTTTGADGSFRFALLTHGHYRLSIVVNGKRREAATALTVPLAAASGPIMIATPAGSITVTLSVAPMAAPDAAQQATTGGEDLSSHAVSSLPLNKRDFSQLLLLAAGTMTDANGATNFTQQFAINGQRGAEATFAMDGGTTTDPEMGGSTFSNFNVDAVEEIQSSSGWMPAEIGFGASGFTDIHTRSGSSGFHGSVFEFVRNSAFDARNFFDHATPATPGRIPPFRRNEFGFTNGGPVRLGSLYDGRGKTFYFGEYQGFRQVLGTTQVFPVPTAAQRPTADSNIVNDTVQFQQADGSTVADTLYVPVNPAIAAILARYPLPNLPTGAYGVNTYATSSKVVTNADQFSIRIDHQLTSKDQFLARFTYDNLTGPTTNPDQTAIDQQFGVQYIDRQRNVMGKWTHTTSPRLVFESLIAIERSTPGFPTPDLTDPAVKFNDSTFEGFNTAGGSVMQAYGNVFQGREMVSWTRGTHAMKFGFDTRLNRDTTYFGTSPDGEYDFGGGSAYAAASIQSASGLHNVAYGDLLPDTLSGFLTGSAAAYTVAIAAPPFSDGVHIGPAAINRNGYAAFAQDTWKVTPRFTLDYGVRWELYTPITERAHRTSGFLKANGVTEFVVNPQPGYKTDSKGWMPRVQAAWQATDKMQVHAGGAVTLIQPNIWQDNFLTGSTPFAVYPRLVGALGKPVPYGFTISPTQLPTPVTPTGQPIFPTGNPKRVAPNTVLDVDRYEKELAALGASDVVSDLNLSGIDRNFSNARLYTWTAGFERKVGNLTADANYVGTAANHLPRTSFPNAYPYASPGFAPDTTFAADGSVSGGLGVENLITATAHSSYHALQTSLSGTVPAGGPGVQASYTWSKSLDDTSQVIGGTGSTGAVTQGFPQDPTNTHPEKGPSAFDVAHGFTLSVAQDLHGDKAPFLSAIPRSVTGGWELLSISSISSGSPFTVYSGVQQTGYGSEGADRPDQVGKPDLSTARQDRADYFGKGLDNPSFFNIPVHVTDGSGPNDGRFGTLGRNTFRGAAYYDFDFALIKDTSFGHRRSGSELMDLQFRSEFFNIFNIVNMGLPANIVNGAGFGEISKTAGTSRQIQFSLKLIY